MSNSKILLSFDIEEFDLPEEFGISISDVDKYEISRIGTRVLLDVLKQNQIKATFFTTVSFAERYPEFIKEMVDDSLEIGSHGMNHSTFETADLKKSKSQLEKLSGTEVIGFRMPRLAKVDKAEITAAGYIYESSLNPVFLPGRYCNLKSPLLPFKEKCGLWQFPISALPLVRFPLFWLTFKNFPLPLYNQLAAITAKTTNYYNMYSHPWEYAREAADKKWHIPGYIVRHAGEKQALRLDSFIRSIQNHGEFITFKEYLSNDI